MKSHPYICDNSGRYNGFPVRGWIYAPTNPPSPPNVVMLMHGTIEMSGQTPMDAADRFIKLAADDTKINLASNILFSCA